MHLLLNICHKCSDRFLLRLPNYDRSLLMKRKTSTGVGTKNPVLGSSQESPESDDKEEEAEEGKIKANRVNDCEDNGGPEDV